MNTSDPSKELMGKTVFLKPYSDQYIVRGYDPHNGKWWITRQDGSRWVSKIELQIIE